MSTLTKNITVKFETHGEKTKNYNVIKNNSNHYYTILEKNKILIIDN